ncbi:MAG: hypothetical protein HOH05_06505 [Marinovum sp.]|nr:hypothetical protein [Marinovum sp.]
MIIAQISDTHINLNTPGSDQRLLDFEKVIHDINSLDPQPNLIIHSGDIVQNGRMEEYAEATRILSKATAPVYVMAGNKDNRKNLKKSFAKDTYISAVSKFIEYEINDFPIRLIMVDTLNTHSNKGHFCDSRQESLVKMINSETTKPIAVFMHHPPCAINVGPDPFHFDNLDAMEGLCDTLQHSDRVISIFCGHVHRSTTAQIANIPVTVTTAIATQIRWGDYPAQLSKIPVYNLHRYDQDWGFITESRIASSNY